MSTKEGLAARKASQASFLSSGCGEEAADWAGKALRMRPNYLTAVRGAAASHALAGRLNEAQKFMTQMRGLDPVLRIVNLNELLPLRRQEHFDRWREGLRLAGLPE